MDCRSHTKICVWCNKKICKVGSCSRSQIAVVMQINKVVRDGSGAGQVRDLPRPRPTGVGIGLDMARMRIKIIPAMGGEAGVNFMLYLHYPCPHYRSAPSLPRIFIIKILFIYFYYISGCG